MKVWPDTPPFAGSRPLVLLEVRRDGLDNGAPVSSGSTSANGMMTARGVKQQQAQDGGVAAPRRRVRHGQQVYVII